ncbi:MAG: tRNA (adenosine(37)-N6)-dimethylallyltransferase MiaA [Candidatus Woykebacteria bacterium RBG_13_40_7b]|uniref:tRNA dimethylallyltransferase n=1 Tax=Candidatus Woykebacteria bacterium RBG_13_40_7b TaxID=1802594 RepID=A0A1G1W848_9BACT|nr:MAG: tRNA (adenosine(37)-N6)-dimethylallyltransferase MiaA [Candidatus Woykebacteria bacterium RBG_13_40_7b]
MNKLLIICGPTATGKTDLALKLAEKFNGELVSADSRQIYKGMDIGTGKLIKNEDVEVKKEEGRWIVDSIIIHLYDLIKPNESFTLYDFQQKAYSVIEEIEKKKKLPILVGGTGLYIRSVVDGLKIPKAPPDLNLRRKLAEKTPGRLYDELKKVDPKTASVIDQHNQRRLIRALEVYHLTGKPISSLKGKFEVEFGSLFVGLVSPRHILYQRTDQRIEKWVAEGFLEEVKKLKEEYSFKLPALTSLGYRQLGMFLDGSLPYEEAIRRIKFDHHNYIRRQMTWFKKEKRIDWFDITDKDYPKSVESFVASWLS